MNCHRCHHTNETHAKSSDCDSLTGLGECMIPGCTCRQYSDGIKMIDEDLL